MAEVTIGSVARFRKQQTTKTKHKLTRIPTYICISEKQRMFLVCVPKSEIPNLSGWNVFYWQPYLWAPLQSHPGPPKKGNHCLEYHVLFKKKFTSYVHVSK